MKKLLAVFIALTCVITCAFGLTACGNGGDGGGGGTHTKHNWSTTYTPDGDRHYQTCDGCTEKQYGDHNYGTDDVCVCGKTKPAAAHTSHNWSTTYTPDGDRHYQTCDGCTEKKYGDHDYGTSGVCVCGKQKPSDYVSVASVTLNKTSLTLEINGSETLTATVLPTNATNKTVSWSSDKPAIADVDSNGKVTAKADGTAIITATADGKSATCTVTVNKATTPTANKYAEIVVALETRVREEKGYEEAEIITIYQYTNASNSYLACVIKTANNLRGVTTRVTTNGHSLTAETIDINYYVAEISNTRLSTTFTYYDGLYLLGRANQETEMVSSMITKLLGDGYTIMYGSISDATNDNAYTASFTVYALLEKDGSVFSYNDTLSVSKGYGNVYETVLRTTEENKDSVYQCNNNVPTDLGEVAKLYLAESKKGQ